MICNIAEISESFNVDKANMYLVFVYECTCIIILFLLIDERDLQKKITIP